MKNSLKKSLVIFSIVCFIVFGYLFFSFQEIKVVEAGTGDNVSGWAWSESIGWISFNNTSGGGATDYGVDVDSTTGVFSGYAWSENIGWINFGSPTTETFIQITNCVELQNIQNDLNADYVLMNDIDCSDTVNWNWDGDSEKYLGFEPIGGNFNGTLEGMDYKITSLYINRISSEDEDIGLFDNIGSDGLVENVGLENADINGYEDLGALTGENYGIINNCYSTGSIFGISNKAGGLVGINEGNISNSYSSAIITDSDSNSLVVVGGLVGENNLEGEIINSYATGSVDGETWTGGLVGSNNGLINNSYATGSVSSNSANIGGLVGENQGVIDNSYSTGDVLGDEKVGG